MPTPSKRIAGKLKADQQDPAPPKSRDELLAEVAKDPVIKRECKLQRQHWTSNNYNAIQGNAYVFAEWVMEEEAPLSTARFLRYATRRAFIEDMVLLRIQVHKVQLTAASRIAITLSTKTGHYADRAFTISNSNFYLPPDAPADEVQLRTLNVRGAGISTAKDLANIELQVDGALNLTYLSVPILLPAPKGADAEERDGESYLATVDINQGGQTYQAKSPPIEAVRWWAKPSENLGVARVDYTAAVPLVDGEDYFAEVSATLAAAGLGEKVYLASWSFNPYTMLTQAQNGLDNVHNAYVDLRTARREVQDAEAEVGTADADLATANDLVANADAGGMAAALLQQHNAGQAKIAADNWKAQADADLINAEADATNEAAAAFPLTMAGKIKDAAGRGAEIYILLDYFNAEWAQELLTDLQPEFGAAAAHIHVAKSRHPRELVVGVGRLKTKRQLGSYHEKYLCVTGGLNRALIGGIDSMPDRVSPWRHAWRSDHNDYLLLAYLCLYRTFNGGWEFCENISGFGAELQLWHDIGIKVEGAWPVHCLAEDFVRRWNDAVPLGDRIPYPVAPAALAAGTLRKIQFVKTDRIEPVAPLPRNTIPAGKNRGTLDCHLMAIRTARHYIYFENQYVRDVEMKEAMCAALAANPLLQIIVVIPYQTEEAARIGNRVFKAATLVQIPWVLDQVENRGHLHGDYLQHEFIQSLRAVAPTRVGSYGLATALAGAADGEEIYPHAKTMIVDDTWAYIGSANANGRSMNVDGESGYVVHDRAVVTAYRKHLFDEHTRQQPETRAIRTFRSVWDGIALKLKASPSDCTAAELVNTAAVELGEPPRGQKYNGPGSWLGVSSIYDQNV
jgi:phosphatidylserine/phosphatidylglycerophosphate/cardiolipin synthase-like enzyme